jgi:predicted DsbA family dithiol-disulfide isomerase
MKVWIALTALVLLIISVQVISSVFASKSCPSNMYGTNEAKKIKYFSSPLCLACWMQKPMIENVAKEIGDQFMLEEYNVDFCREAAAPHYIRGVPAFLVNDTVLYGVYPEESIKKMIA